MKSEQEYINDLTEIRSMMERSTKFLSLSGWSGIMAGVYALAGAYIAHRVLNFGSTLAAHRPMQMSDEVLQLILLAVVVLLLAVSTTIWMSYRKAEKKGEKLWNPVARRLVFNMAVPLLTGGFFSLILLFRGLTDLIAPATLIFYGLALLSAGKFSFDELRQLGLINVALGLAGAYFPQYGLLLWAIGFGVMHIVYGLFMHLKYEK